MRTAAWGCARLLVLSCWVLIATGCDDDTPSDGDADSDVDGDGDGDGDVDGDSDSDGDEDVPCTGDEECADDLYCNGEERCEDGACVAGDPVVCDDEDDCTEDFCSERTERCAYSTRDQDEDGFGDGECGGDDCDDSAPEVNPEGVEVQCNGADDNCDGRIDEPTPRRLTEHDGYSWGASLVWTGTELAMAWSDNMVDTSQIYFARLDVDGTLLMEPVAVSDSWLSEEPSLAWTGSEFAVAWQEGVQVGAEDSRYRISFVRFAADGTVASTENLTDAADFARLPSLIWTGTEFGVAWSDSRPSEDQYHTYFNRVSTAGIALGDDLRVSDNATEWFTRPSVVWTGTEYAAVWSEPIAGNYEIWFARISSAGAVIGSPRRVLGVTGQFCMNSRLVATESGFGMTWSDGLGVYFALLTDEGALDGDTLILTDEESDITSAAAVVWTGSEFGVVWNDFRDSDDDLYFTRISAEGIELIDHVEISQGPRHSLVPSIAWTGSEYTMVWSDFRFGNNEILYARVCVSE